MPVRTAILTSHYQDSVVLMRAAAELRARPGVRQAAALMATGANLALLERAGLLDGDTRRARPDDLVLAVEAETAAEAEAAVQAGRDLVLARRRAGAREAAVAPRTLESALRRLPAANLAAISVPGAFAAPEALRALRRNLHVFLFSDNVPLADEVALKQEARRRGLLCMGPDCGTAYLGGVGLGFANVVPRGRVGCVAASGTGLQAVASRLAALGEGISHGIGVGGRDLSAEVDGLMTTHALAALASDPATAALVVVAKPPHPRVLPRLEAALAAVAKPVVACGLGAAGSEDPGRRWVANLADAADAAVAALAGRAWTPRLFEDPAAVRARLTRCRGRGVAGPGVLGLFTGGTLAQEARLLLESLVGPVGSDEATGAPGPDHRVLDLGDDRYTVGRPHPMIDAEARAERLVEAGRDPRVGIVLLDLVLGRGAHPDPAGPVAAALGRARAAAAVAGRALHAVASVVGTRDDPQGLATQVARLETAGVEVLPTSAEAARFAALLARPELAGRLLGAGS
jgi:FdrA protein